MIDSYNELIPTQIYSTITFEHDMTLEFPLNLEIGDILMVSISLKDPDTAGRLGTKINIFYDEYKRNRK